MHEATGWETAMHLRKSITAGSSLQSPACSDLATSLAICPLNLRKIFLSYFVATFPKLGPGPEP